MDGAAAWIQAKHNGKWLPAASPGKDGGEVWFRPVTKEEAAGSSADAPEEKSVDLAVLLGKAGVEIPVPEKQVEEEASFFFQRFDLAANGVIDFSEFAELIDEIGMLPQKADRGGSPPVADNAPTPPAAPPAEESAQEIMASMRMTHPLRRKFATDVAFLKAEFARADVDCDGVSHRGPRTRDE